VVVGVGVGHLCHSFVGGQGAVCGRVAFCKGREVRSHWYLPVPKVSGNLGIAWA